jgi:ABC-type Fe3+-siderophore transport system permease subunit
MKRRWLWIIFMLFGFGRYSFNWTTGQMAFQPIFIQLIPTSAFKGAPYAPWIIYICMPFGALLFLWKRRKITKRELVEVLVSSDSNDIVTDEVDS